MAYNQAKAQQTWRNTVSNVQGHIMEQEVERACSYYRDKGIAYIEKTPEPFRMLKKQKDGQFLGRVGKAAQPDFKGTLCGGRAMVFEAKYTDKDRIQQNRLTDEQTESLETHWNMGAEAGVVVQMHSEFYYVPWVTWSSMKELFGRKYMTAEDLKRFEVPYRQGIMFLEHIER